MPSSTSMVLAAMVLCLAAVASAQRVTLGQRFAGFTFGSDVVGYTNMTKDICDIKAAVARGDLAAASMIYSNGANSVSGRTLRNFKGWALAAHPGEITYDLIKAYHVGATSNSTTFVDDMIVKAFADRKGARALSLINVLVNFKYGFHEIDVSLRRTKANNESTNPLTGAPHNMDEGWTIFAGGHPQQCDTPLQQADRLAADLGLSYFGKSPVRNAFTVEFNNAYASSLQGNSSESIARHTVANAVQLTQMTVMHVQGAFRDSVISATATTCRNTKVATDRKDMALSYWDAAAPVLLHYNVPKPLLNAVVREISASRVNAARVRTALNAALIAAKMPTSILGTMRAPSCSSLGRMKL